MSTRLRVLGVLWLILGSAVLIAAQSPMKYERSKFQGGLGIIWLVKDQDGKIKAVVKTADSKNQSKQKRLAEEIQTMEVVGPHPNIVKTLPPSSDMPGLTLEYYTHGDLCEALIERGALSLDQALIYFDQLIAGLEHIHQKGIAHRDIKPDNILIGNDYKIKISDFGLAIAIPEEATTQEERALGTCAWLAFECLAPDQAEFFYPRDIYAAVLVLYAMIAASAVFGDIEEDDGIHKFLDMSHNERVQYFIKWERQALKRLTNVLFARGESAVDIKAVIDFTSQVLTGTFPDMIKKRLGCEGAKPDWEKIRAHAPRPKEVPRNKNGRTEDYSAEAAILRPL